MNQRTDGTAADGPPATHGGRSPGRIGLSGVAIAGVVIVVVGIALIASAPFDEAARTGLGASLLTGAIVGGALIGIEYTLDRRREARADASRRELFQRMAEAANDSLGALVSAHLESAWRWFGAVEAGKDLPPRARPSGWTWPKDAHDLRMTLMWRLEVMTDDRSWWNAQRDLAATDAIYFAVTDVAERFGLELGEEDDANRRQSALATLRRLAGIAQRLSEAGDPVGASRIDGQINALGARETPSAVPRLSVWGDDTYDEIIVVGASPLRSLREELAWLTAELRTSKVKVDRFGDPIGDGPSPEAYRWQPLLGPSEPSDGMWDRRFEEDSWFRRLIAEAAAGLPRTRLGRLANHRPG